MELAQAHTANKGWSQDPNQSPCLQRPCPSRDADVTLPLVAYGMRCVMSCITVQHWFKSLLNGDWRKEEAGCFILKEFSITLSDQERN